jgi:AraC-like DNA-binding protein
MELIDHSFQSLWHQLIEQSTFAGRVSVISKWLDVRYTNVPDRNKALNKFLDTAHKPVPTVKELSRELCYSPRQLARKLIAHTGMNTETLLLYKKYLHSLNLIYDTNLSLTEIAYDCQFADQSHFIKTFRLFSQLTPGEYRKVKSPVKGHFYQNVR